MSYAAVASHGTNGDHGAVPDPSFLEGAHHPQVDAALGREDAAPEGNVNLVDPAEAERMRAAIDKAEHAPDGTAHQVQFVPPPPAEKVDKVKEEASDLKNKATKEGKKVAAEGKELVEEAEEKGKEYLAKAEKKGAEWKEEATEEAEKLKKRALRADKDARAFYHRYPGAVTGAVGLVNVAVLAAVGAVAYSHWDQPRWDRRAVTAATVGLLGFFGAQSALGYWEVEQDKKEQGKK
ncbi:hypothetical protein BCR35DRAFT_324724 [Leucosporidium creatinivorum]|uniref:Mitochondrial outer membrane protein OM14 C-terminal domain-containing protein n=1 Tax=Leucosporidium creatinivorum TaxID=106004 RepID=A0A1Y2FL23_9BASI|nr:hypothetical protein BCR35DRAFT_324724 [Leucosporidium creatinivorum]